MSGNHEHTGAAPGEMPLAPIQIAFIDRLRLLKDSSVYSLPRFDEVISHDGTTPKKDAPLPYQFDGIQLSDAVQSVFGNSQETLPNTFEFEIDEELSMMGREDSHHGVFAGIITMRSRPDAHGKSIEYKTPVAVKPFMLADARFVIQECGIEQYLGAQGVKTHEIIAVIGDRTQDKQPLYVLTRWRPELHSLDTYYNWKDWSQVTPAEVGGVVRERVQPAVGTFVATHTQFVFNSDAHFRNVVVPDRYGDVFVSDLEHATSCRDIIAALGEDDGLPEVLVTAMDQDITAIQRSFKEYIYDNAPVELVPPTEADKLAFELECFIEPYWVALEKSGSPYAGLLLRALDRVVQGKRHKARLTEV